MVRINKKVALRCLRNSRSIVHQLIVSLSSYKPYRKELEWFTQLSSPIYHLRQALGRNTESHSHFSLSCDIDSAVHHIIRYKREVYEIFNKECHGDKPEYFNFIVSEIDEFNNMIAYLKNNYYLMYLDQKENEPVKQKHTKI